jgi:hypothetical protein
MCRLGKIFCFVTFAVGVVVADVSTMAFLGACSCGFPSIYPNELVSGNKRLSIISNEIDGSTMTVLDLKVRPEQRVIIAV